MSSLLFVMANNALPILGCIEKEVSLRDAGSNLPHDNSTSPLDVLDAASRQDFATYKDQIQTADADAEAHDFGHEDGRLDIQETHTPTTCGACGAEQVCGQDGTCHTIASGDSCEGGWCRVPAGERWIGLPFPCDECAVQGELLLSNAWYPLTLTYDYLILQHEVTQDFWSLVYGNNPAHFKNCGGDCPVDSVNWWEMVTFCNELSIRQGLEPCYHLEGCRDGFGDGCPEGETVCLGSYRCTTYSQLLPKECNGYRLPTEVEWEFAARAGTETSTYAGKLTGCAMCEEDPLLDTISWFCANSDGTTHPVGQKLPNPWGLYDVLGNVSEMVDGSFLEWPGLGPDPAPPWCGFARSYMSNHRLIRGGSWWLSPRYHTAWLRGNASLNDRSRQVGFRIVRTIMNPNN